MKKTYFCYKKYLFFPADVSYLWSSNKIRSSNFVLLNM